MYFYIYKITNTINNHIYIGCHQTKNLDDGYMGSGKILRHAQKKHGLDKFTRDILFMCENQEEMFSIEAKIVNEGFVSRNDTYNIAHGGRGGDISKFLTPEHYKHLSKLFKGRESPTNGSYWIHNGKRQLMISKSDPLPEGWSKGRGLYKGVQSGLPINYDTLYDLFITQELTMKDIASKLGVSLSKVKNALYRSDIRFGRKMKESTKKKMAKIHTGNTYKKDWIKAKKPILGA